MKYTIEILKYELVRLFKFSEREAEVIIESHRRNGELDDLADAVREKEKACSRL